MKRLHADDSFSNPIHTCPGINGDVFSAFAPRPQEFGVSVINSALHTADFFEKEGLSYFYFFTVSPISGPSAKYTKGPTDVFFGMRC